MSVLDQQQQQSETGSELQVILEVAAWIIENSGALGGLISKMLGTVTNVKEWVNETDQEIEVWKVDGGSNWKDHYRIPPRQTLRAEMWIPWADNPQQYREHHATLQIGGKALAYLWQSGKLVRCNTGDEFVAGGVGVPGAAGAGGDRRIVFGADPQGRTGFVITTL